MAIFIYAATHACHAHAVMQHMPMCALPTSYLLQPAMPHAVWLVVLFGACYTVVMTWHIHVFPMPIIHTHWMDGG